jgi:hypothetical protein
MLRGAAAGAQALPGTTARGVAPSELLWTALLEVVTGLSPLFGTELRAAATGKQALVWIAFLGIEVGVEA